MGTAYKGLSTGTMPNVHWRSVSWDELRRHTRFIGLPPVSHIDLRSPGSFRYVRQDDDVWDAAHTGVLTTGMLKEALGFLDPSAARVLGLPKAMVSEGAVQRVYHNLLRPAPHAEAVHHAVSQQAESANREAVNKYNHMLLRGQSALQPATAAASTARKRRRRTGKAVQITPSQAQPSAHPGDGVPEPTAGPGLTATALPTAQASAAAVALERARQKALARAQSLGALGLGAIRCAWGSAQEASSLYALLPSFPGSTFQECGLCLVDRTVLQQRYGYVPGQLPPLGASPDGLVYHPTDTNAALPASAQTVQDMTARLADGSAAAAGSPRQNTAHNKAVGDAAQSRCAPAGQVLHLAGNQGTPSHLQGSTIGARSPYGGRSSQQPSVRPASTAAHAADGRSRGAGDVQQLLEELQLLDIAEKGREVLPLLLGDKLESRTGISGVQQRAQDSSIPQSPNSSSTGGVRSDNEANAGASEAGEGILEVVEVKNTCPFMMDVKNRRNGKLKKVYTVSDRGPRTEVSATWVPQLQMEMLAANTESALLVTRSATKGLSVFRMARDDEYIADMLRVLSVLYQQYVLSGKCPGPQPYRHVPGYQRFLLHTLELSRNTPVVLRDEDAHVHVPQSNMHLLLD